MRLDGKVTTGILGADAQWERWLAGVALSVSEGKGTFDQPGVDSGTGAGRSATGYRSCASPRTTGPRWATRHSPRGGTETGGHGAGPPTSWRHPTALSLSRTTGPGESTGSGTSAHRRPAGDGDGGAAVERPAPGAGAEPLRSYPACGACRSIALSRSVRSSRRNGSRSSAARRATKPVRQRRRPKASGSGRSRGQASRSR